MILRSARSRVTAADDARGPRPDLAGEPSGPVALPTAPVSPLASHVNMSIDEPTPRRRLRLPAPAIRLNRLAKPQTFLLVPAVLSLAAWLVPGTGYVTRGYVTRSHPSVTAVLLVIGWYVVAEAATLAGIVPATRLLRRSALRRDPIPRSSTDFVSTKAYLTLTVLAAIGLLFCCVKLASELPLWHLIVTHQVNVLKNALSNGPGLQTLRYTADLSGAVAIERAIERRRPSWLDAGNIVMLGIVGLLSGRLGILLALTVVLSLEAARHPDAAIRLVTIVLIVLVIFLVFTPISYLRTAGTYEKAGVADPLSITALQVVSYLGVPAQVEMGVVNAAIHGRLRPDSSSLDGAFTAVVRPTYLSHGANSTANPQQAQDGPYHGVVSVSPSYTTNSTLADTYTRDGLWGLALVLIVLAIAAAVYAVLISAGGSFVLAAGVLLYPFAEIWRLYLFNQGIIQYLLLIAIAVGAAMRLETRRLISRIHGLSRRLPERHPSARTKR